MADSLQKWVGRNRPPRVQITYDVEIGDAVEKKELPLVVGLLADLSGQPATPLPKLKERRLVEIDRDNFNEIMGKISPRLDLSVPDTMKGEGNLKVELNFKEFDDFHPEAIVKQVPRLAKLLEARQQLRDLLAKLDGNDEHRRAQEAPDRSERRCRSAGRNARGLNPPSGAPGSAGRVPSIFWNGESKWPRRKKLAQKPVRQAPRAT
jgi:type VI secretion system protein ImpB